VPDLCILGVYVVGLVVSALCTCCVDLVWMLCEYCVSIVCMSCVCVVHAG